MLILLEKKKNHLNFIVLYVVIKEATAAVQGVFQSKFINSLTSNNFGALLLD